MRILPVFSLIMMPAGFAAAHTISGDVTAEIAHRFLSLHHLPLVFLIMAALALLLAKGVAARRN